jgi:hypothetical protein
VGQGECQWSEKTQQSGEAHLIYQIAEMCYRLQSDKEGEGVGAEWRCVTREWSLLRGGQQGHTRRSEHMSDCNTSPLSSKYKCTVLYIHPVRLCL